MTVTVQLDPQLETLIRQQIDSGRYQDASDVVRDALRLFDRREQQTLRLRAKLESGLAQIERGEVVEMTPDLFETLERNARRRAEAGDEPSPDVTP